jgi:ABC-type multidrug transport system permease subunit
VRFAWACTLKDLRRLRRDPIAMAIWLGLPILICVLLVLIFGSGSVAPQGKLLLADEDSSFVSSLLAGAFSQGPLGEMLVVEKVSPQDGRARINRGDGSALLVVPKGFGNAVLKGEASRLKLVTNPTQNILPQIAEQSVSTLVEAVFYVQTLAGDRISALASGTAPADQQVAEASIEFNRLATRVSGFLDPRRIDLETEVVETKGAGSVNLTAAFIPSMLFLSVLFLAMGFSGEVWKERRQAVLRRLLVTPGRVESFLIGRVLSLAAVLLLAAGGAVLIARAVLTVSVTSAVAAVAFTILSGVCLYLILQLVVVYAPSERAANILSNLLLFPLAMVGGSFAPFEVMPQWLASIGRLTPNGWAVAELGEILAGKSGPLEAGVVSLRLLALAAVAFDLIVRRLRRGFAL